MTIEFDNPRKFEDTESLLEWMWQNLQKIEQEFNLPRDFYTLAKLYEAPRKLKEGMTVLASGYVDGVVGFDPPGTGAVLGDNMGVYTYYGGAWHKLG